MSGGQGASLLEVLRKKITQTRDELEKKRDDCDELKHQLNDEVRRREEVRFHLIYYSY